MGTTKRHSNWFYRLLELQNGLVASASWDNTIKIWNTLNTDCMKTLEGHSLAVSSLAVISDTKLASGSYDSSIKIWNSTTGECISTLQGHSGGGIYCLSLLAANKLASGTFICCGYLDPGFKEIKIWDLKHNKCIQTLEGHTHDVTCLVSLSNNQLASGSWDNRIKVWDLNTGKCVNTYQGHTSGVLSLIALDNNKLLASSSYDKKIKIWYRI